MTTVVIGLSAVVVAVRDRDAVVLTVRTHDPRTGEASRLLGLPFGPFDPDAHRTFELAMRAFVTEQTRFELGYVEQLYTFGDRGRDAPRADVGAGEARVISVGYLALTPKAVESLAPDTVWTPYTRFFPWEDWRKGRPQVIDEVIAPRLAKWAGSDERRARARLLFGLDGAPWNEERVLERYELLYEAGLAPEAQRDRSRAATEPEAFDAALGEPMLSDHRRILATGLGRLRGKLRYRPVAFQLTPPEFTLSQLQRTVEAVAGVALHKQNFRRGLERTDLVEGLGRWHAETGGRPAELFRFRRERLLEGPAPGLALPR
ncbi:MAG TPA: NAD regulator [Caulobacteraceae bacterium]|nr:NAD regulator [Caulobacteraceae bacterium]